MKTIDKLVYSLCEEIDSLKEEVKYWKNKAEEERDNNTRMIKDNLKSAERDVANALLFTLSVNDDPNGNLVISKESRKMLSKTWQHSQPINVLQQNQ